MGLFSKIKNMFKGGDKPLEKEIEKEIDKEIEIDEDKEEVVEIKDVKKTVKDESVKVYEKGLTKSRKNFVSRLADLTNKYSKINEDYFEELEEILIMADIGVNTVLLFIERLKKHLDISSLILAIDRFDWTNNGDPLTQNILSRYFDMFDKIIITTDDESLTDFGIQKSWLTRFPQELSGGELQRFSVLRSLNPKTKFLIADEMTTMLDAITQVQILESVLKIVKERNMGFLLVSHDMDLVDTICDDKIYLKDINGV